MTRYGDGVSDCGKKQRKMQTKFLSSLADYLSAAYPILVIESHEEARCLMEISKWAEENKKTLVFWDCIAGMMKVDGTPFKPDTADFLVALSQFTGGDALPGIFVFKDAHHSMIPPAVRLLRNIVGSLKARRTMLVFLSPMFDVPLELKKDVQFLDFGLPTREDHELILNGMVDAVAKKGKEIEVEPDGVQLTLDSATGLTKIEAENAFALALIKVKNNGGGLKIGREYARHVFEEKVQAFRQSLLEYVPTYGGFDTVGGLEEMKTWVRQRRVGFTQEARDLHLPFPKGILLAGVRGCGKTVSAAAIAHEFNFPFYKLDLGRLFGSLIGQSEANTRELIRLLEGMGNAVVLMDEMEKYLSQNATSGKGDSGTSSRMFGTLVSWMATKKCPTFLIATVNSVDNLPPELIRKGRFDELFFVDLPGDEERLAIVKTLLEHKFHRDITKGPWADSEKARSIIKATREFSGAEIEACIQDGLYRCLEKKETKEEQVYKYLLASCLDTKPQAQLNSGQLEAQRKSAKANFRFANSTATNKTAARDIDV